MLSMTKEADVSCIYHGSAYTELGVHLKKSSYMKASINMLIK